jgi:hypothetical protein
LTVARAHVTIAAMSFWEDLSPAVKGYLGIAAVLLVLVLAFRACTGQGGPDAPQTPRTQQR